MQSIGFFYNKLWRKTNIVYDIMLQNKGYEL